MTLEDLIAQLHPAVGVADFLKVDRRLQRHAGRDRLKVLEAYLRYMHAGSVEHLRQRAASTCADLVGEGEAQYAQAFESGLSARSTAYWSVLGLAKCLGKASFPILTAFALDPGNGTDARAHAIKVLADASRQTFVGGLSADPGDWRLEELPLHALTRWREAGYPDGVGFRQPMVSPELENPTSEIDQLAVRLEKKLRRY